MIDIDSRFDSMAAPARRRQQPLVRRLRTLLAVAIYASFLAAAGLCILAESRALLRILGSDTFALASVGGVFAAYIGWERSERRRLIALWSTAFGMVVWLGAVGIGAWETANPAAILWVPGIVGFAMHCRRAAAAGSFTRGVWLLRLRDALVIPAGVALTPFMLLASADLTFVFDLHVLAFEDTLGPRFSALSVGFFKDWPSFGGVSIAAYLLLPAGIALAMAALERTRPPLDALLAFATLTAVGYTLYWVFPVVGPRQVFGAYPYAFPPVGGFEVRAIELHLLAPRNGMPSLHTAWALMIWFVAAGAGARMRLALRLFAALNIAATMGAEDSHWITDLIVAVPMTVAVCAATMIDEPLRGLRLAAIVVGAVTTAVALALLYAAIPVFQALPALSWLYVVATTVPSLAINRALWRAALARRVRQEPRPSAAT